MDCVGQWVPQGALSLPITYAACSCNSELSEPEGMWGVTAPVDNGIQNGRTAPSSIISNQTSEQLQR
ncbi:hypothetical protein PVL29_005508 [Vitis rotundifolia]|uniref:Uncharacterized protein n=1 Tax=Vitis rotundifolia TaxID=103349 RepID=A0AA39A4B3_VITRO|nr:hypothetical protein PVL29_005508 [Vitis rotundifolia]